MVQLYQDDREAMLDMQELFTLQEADIPSASFAMRELDEMHIEQLANSDFTKWPPIYCTRVANDSGTVGYAVYDGYHRIAALKTKGVSHIRARVKTFEYPLHIVEATFRANLAHGLPLSQQKVYDYCYWLSVQYPDLTQEQIAGRVGVNQSTVHRAIDKAINEQREALKAAAEKAGDIETVQQLEIQALAPVSKKLVRFLKDFRVKSLTKFSSETEAIAYMQQFMKSPEDRKFIAEMATFLLQAANVPVATTGKHTSLKQFAVKS